MRFRYGIFTKIAPPLLFAMAIALLTLYRNVPAVSVQSTRLPHPFQFTENKGQWDSAVLYKCEVRCDGFTWFLERDGVTLVTSVIDSSSFVGAVRERTDPFSSRGGLPRPPASGNDVAAVGAYGIRPDHESFPLKSHALKFKFVDSRRGESHSPLRINARHKRMSE